MVDKMKIAFIVGKQGDATYINKKVMKLKSKVTKRLLKRPPIPFKIFMPTVVQELSYQVILFTPH